MPFATVGGRRLSYEERGAGRPVLLLHGFPFTSESFWPQLGAPPSGFRLIVPDHRGFGMSEPAPGPATMEALAEDALALLDALGVPQAVVGGVSMGGYVAIALTRRDPGRVKALVLMDTQSSADDEAGKARREAVAKEVEESGVSPVVEALLPKLMAPAVDPTVRARVEKMMRAQSPAAVAAASRGMATRADGKDILSRFGGPCLVVVGEQDLITPPEKARAMASLMPQAQVAVIPGAGHLANLEAPEALSRVLAPFLQST
ncbi:MAG: alpha/beta fold hydrolase [Myxococcales bacterium]|nr:alpha/beta fold hydrolase [Myxococcales bacterium]